MMQFMTVSFKKAEWQQGSRNQDHNTLKHVVYQQLVCWCHLRVHWGCFCRLRWRRKPGNGMCRRVGESALRGWSPRILSPTPSICAFPSLLVVPPGPPLYNLEECDIIGISLSLCLNSTTWNVCRKTALYYMMLHSWTQVAIFFSYCRKNQQHDQQPSCQVK